MPNRKTSRTNIGIIAVHGRNIGQNTGASANDTSKDPAIHGSSAQAISTA